MTRRVRTIALLVALLAGTPLAARAQVASVGTPLGAAGTNVTSVTKAYTAASTSNELAIVCAIDNSATATLTADNNGAGTSATQFGGPTNYGTNASQRVALFYVNPPSTAAVTWRCLSSVGAQDINIHILELSGVVAIGNAATPISGTADPMSISLTTQDANNAVVSGCASRGTSAPTTTTSGTLATGEFSNAVDREASAEAYKLSATATSVTVAVTLPGGAGLGNACVAGEFRSTAGGGGSPLPPSGLTILGVGGPGQ